MRGRRVTFHENSGKGKTIAGRVVQPSYPHERSFFDPNLSSHTCETVSLGGKQAYQNRESSESTQVPSQTMDLSEVPAGVRLNMKRSPLESQGDRSKQETCVGGSRWR